MIDKSPSKGPGESLITADRAGKHVRGSCMHCGDHNHTDGTTQRSCYHKLSNLHVDTCHWTNGVALIIRTQVIFDWSCLEQSTQWFLSFSGQTQSHSFIFTSPLKHLWGGKQRSAYSKVSILIKKRSKHQMMLNRIECSEERGVERVCSVVFDLVSLFPAICFGHCQKPLWWLPGKASPLSRLPLCLRDF